MPTYRQIFEKDIRRLLTNKTKRGRSINAKNLRTKADKVASNLLELNNQELDYWHQYYNLESARLLEEGDERGLNNLERKNLVANQEEAGTRREVVALKKIILTGLGKDPSLYHLGHKDIGPAMFKAKLWLDYAVPVNKAEAQIIQEQKRLVAKMLRVYQYVERIHNDDVLDIMKDSDIPIGQGVDDDVLLELVSRVNEKVKIDQDFIMQTSTKGVELKFKVTFESGAENLASGELTKLMGIKLNKLINIKKKEELDTFKSTDFGKTLLRVPGSWTYLQRVGRFLSSAVAALGKKNQPRYDRPSRHTNTHVQKVPRNNLINAAAIAYHKKKKALENKIRGLKAKLSGKPKVPTIDVFNLQNLINRMMHLHVKAQMGEYWEAPIRLRYQSGRFARSARLVTLTRVETNTLAGMYTYQHRPYDVFLPGQPLGSAARNPKGIIERGIRTAAYSILEDKYPGINPNIVLESD